MATVTIRPNGDSATHDGAWLLQGGTAGQAYTCINESSTDDSVYIYNNDTTSPYERQAVTLEDMPAASAISSVVMKWRSRSAFSTLSTIPFIRVSGSDTDASSATVVTTTDTEYSWDITALQSWTDTLINGLEIGWRKNATANNTLRVTQAWVEITYTAAGTPLDMGSASCAIVFGGSGTLISIQPLTGSSALAFGGSATMNRLMGLTGASSVSFGGSASMNRLMGMTATSALAFGGSASMAMLMGLSGSSALQFGATGDLTIITSGGVLNMGTATAAIVFGGTATMNRVMGLSGSSAIAFNATATMNMLLGMSGTSAIIFTATGTLFIPAASDTRSRGGVHGTMGRVAIWIPNHSRGGVHRA